MRVKYRVFFTAPLLFNPQLPKLLLNICNWNQHLEQKGSQPTSWHWASRSVRFGRLRPFCEAVRSICFCFFLDENLHLIVDCVDRWFITWYFASILCLPLENTMILFFLRKHSQSLKVLDKKGSPMMSWTPSYPLLPGPPRWTGSTYVDKPGWVLATFVLFLCFHLSLLSCSIVSMVTPVCASILNSWT